MYQFQIISKSRPVTKIWGTRPNEFRSFFQDWHVRKCKENREVAVSDMQRPLTWWGSAMPREICHSYLPSIQEHVSISLISTLSFLYRRKQNGFINLPWSCSLPSTMVLLPLQNHWKTTGKLQKPKSPLAWQWFGIGLAGWFLGDSFCFGFTSSCLKPWSIFASPTSALPWHCVWNRKTHKTHRNHGNGNRIFWLAWK